VRSLNKDTLFNLILAILVTITVTSLWSVGESRGDVYISLYTLEYLVLKAVLRPRRKTVDFIAIALLASFMFFVTRRILEVLGL
jgi:hypothetical protein